MRKHSPIIPLFLASLAVWAAMMTLVVRHHASRNERGDIAAYSSDVTFAGEERTYYSVYRNGAKIGYRSEVWLKQPHSYLVSEETVLKMNLAGRSREVFIQSIAAIDSATLVTGHISFNLGAASHTYSFNGSLAGDSLAIRVRKNTLDPERTGTFLVNEFTTIPAALPFFIDRTRTQTMSFQVFDPLMFGDYLLHGERGESEIHSIDGTPRSLVRTDILYNNRRGVLWFDEDGKIARAENYPLFGGFAGSFTLEQTETNEVFMLPVDVSFGMDILHELAIRIRDILVRPRAAQTMTVELEGIRAANIDLGDPAKELISANPVVFRIHNRPVVSGEPLELERQLAGADTSLLGSSDYIQPTDARIRRAARSAAGSLADTLAIAHALRRWVTESMEPMEGLDLVRSVDILRELKGGSDEYTKLFTALARSLGIPTQIHLGLAYDDGAFRYHSWPAVFAGGTWHSLDPFFGQDAADATHITLVRGDFERLADLIRIVGPLSITVREAR